MKRVARAVAKWLFHVVLGIRVPMPVALRDRLRAATRAYFHRSRLFRHDSRLHAAPLALRLLHECVIRTHPTEFTIYGGQLRFRSSGSPMSMHGYYVGEFEYHLVRFIVDRLADHSIVLDVGAHHGEFAVPIAHEFRERRWSSTIWSFEPDPENFEFLTENLRINGLTSFVTARPLAVTDTSSEAAELLCPADNSSNTLGSNAAFAIGEELPFVRRRSVKTIRIDGIDFGPTPIRILKLDIQGSEPEALLGAIGTLSRHRPIVVVEVVKSWPRASEVEAILRRLGYTVHGLTRAGELVPLDDSRVFISWDWIALPPAWARPIASTRPAVGIVGASAKGA